MSFSKTCSLTGQCFESLPVRAGAGGRGAIILCHAHRVWHLPPGLTCLYPDVMVCNHTVRVVYKPQRVPYQVQLVLPALWNPCRTPVGGWDCCSALEAAALNWEQRGVQSACTPQQHALVLLCLGMERPRFFSCWCCLS